MNAKDIKEFEYKFRAKVRPSRDRYVVSHPPSYPTFDSKINYEAELITKTVPAVEIIISQESFEDILDTLDERSDLNKDWQLFTHLTRVEGERWIQRSIDINSKQHQEAILREKNPALKKAWEHYRTLLNLSY